MRHSDRTLATPARLEAYRLDFEARGGKFAGPRPRNSVWYGDDVSGRGVADMTLVVAEEFDAARIRVCLRDRGRKPLEASRLANADWQTVRVGCRRVPLAVWLKQRKAKR